MTYPIQQRTYLYQATNVFSKHSVKLILRLLIIFISNFSFGVSIVQYTEVNNVLHIGGSVQILEDKTNKLTINEVIKSAAFKQSTQDVPNLNITPYSYWIKVQIKNLTNEESLLLDLAHPITDEVEFYSASTDSTFNVEKLGEYKPYDQRKYDSPDYIFDVHILKNEVKTYYLKVRSGDQIEIRLLLGTTKALLESTMRKDFFFGIYCGIIIVMSLYNLFIFITVRDKSYLYYVLYCLTVGLTQACIHGYAFKYIWPSFPWIAIQSMQIVPALAGIALIEFSKLFLSTKKFTPLLHKIFYVLLFIYLASIILSLFHIYNLSQQLVQITALLLSLYLLYVAIRIAKKGYRPAIFFLIAWSLFLISVCAFVLQTAFGIVHSSSFGSYTLVIGSALEVVLLSFALADRINIMKREKEESQAQTLLTLQENERIIKEQNVTLEAKVKERTLELETSNKNLKDTQSQLVDAEKMASLGQLTAGIAHEINNPINFVISNVKPLKRDVEEILLLLNKYNELTDGKNIDEKLKEIQTLKEKLDPDYLTKEIDLLLKGIDEGAYRTSDIVKGLQNFSRLDESDSKKVNIHEGIDATLKILNSNINKEKINIIKNYGELPLIDCLPGKLNQVFMNILNNAIQAMPLARNGENKNTITITTKADGSNVIISIKDNGLGIPKNIQSKIFDPFFTTKQVGVGTGLGLSIVYGIIKTHNGTIKVESEEGKGAEFTIVLPIQLQKNNH